MRYPQHGSIMTRNNQHLSLHDLCVSSKKITHQKLAENVAKSVMRWWVMTSCALLFTCCIAWCQGSRFSWKITELDRFRRNRWDSNEGTRPAISKNDLKFLTAIYTIGHHNPSYSYIFIVIIEKRGWRDGWKITVRMMYCMQKVSDRTLCILF